MIKTYFKKLKQALLMTVTIFLNNRLSLSLAWRSSLQPTQCIIYEFFFLIGNQQLLDRSPAWQKLLKFYRKNNCVVKADEVSVHEVSS